MSKPLTYRPVLNERGRFAEWVNDLRNQSGAYVIRSKGTHEVLYVGESHTGRLAATIKRHFYSWDADKGYSARAAGVEVAVRVCPQSAAVSVQDSLIQRLTPRVNKMGYGSKDEVPF